MSAYQKDRYWSDKFIPQIKTMVGPLLLEPSDLQRDAIEATDLMVLVAHDMRIAARVRRYGFADRYPWEFTIRARRDSGAETELSKIVNGWGDWLFYGHADEGEGYVDRWMIVDLHAFRAGLIRQAMNSVRIKCGDKANGDGTFFKWFDVRSFPASPSILVASSHDINNREEAA